MIYNTIKTIVLLGALTMLLLALGNLIGGTAGVTTALLIALLINGIAFFFSDKMVLGMYRAQPLDTQTYSYIYTMVQDLAYSMNIAMPRLWLITTPTANAFATGRSPRHASIAVTTGIVNILDHDELRGVLAHELAHIKNRDTLITTLAAVFAAAIGYIAYMLRHALLWSALSSDRRRNNNPFALIIVSVLMPFAATLLQLALSRSREYMADETGSYYSHDPLSLASALEKLHNHARYDNRQTPETHHASMASLFIVHPFTTDQSWMTLFSTHPPLHKRVMRLRKLFEKTFS